MGTGLLTVNSGTTFDLGSFSVAVGGLSGSWAGPSPAAAPPRRGAAAIVTGATAQTFSGVIEDTPGSGNQTLSVAIAGSGMQAFSGSNSYSGGTTISSGTLNIANSSALGTGILTIGTGTTINNTSGAVLTLATNNAQIWNGNFTFTGSNDLNLGTGNVTMAGAGNTSQVVTLNGHNLTVGGNITSTNINDSLFLQGTGTLTLGGSNSISRQHFHR